MNNSEWNFAPVMKDPELEEQLKRDGVVVIPEFLDKAAVKELVDYHTANQPEFVNYDTIINSVWHSNDQDYKIKTIKRIIDIYTPPCDKYFQNYNIFGGSFVIKMPFGEGESCPHIDFGIVNEEVHRSFNLWIPLVPTTHENGALKVLKGSHRIKHTFRGPNIPDQTIEAREWLYENMETYELQPGDAILYDHKAIHGSKPNNSTEPRIAVSCALTNADADMVLYFWDEKKQKVVGYVTDPEYLLTNNHDKLPTDLKIVGEWDYSFEQLSLEDLGAKPEPEPGFFDRVLAMFKN